MHIKKYLRQGQALLSFKFDIDNVTSRDQLQTHSLNWLALKDFHNSLPEFAERLCTPHYYYSCRLMIHCV